MNYNEHTYPGFILAVEREDKMCAQEWCEQSISGQVEERILTAVHTASQIVCLIPEPHPAKKRSIQIDQIIVGKPSPKVNMKDHENR